MCILHRHCLDSLDVCIEVCVCGHVFVCWVCMCIYVHALRYRNVCTVCASMCMRLCVYTYINIVTTVITLVHPTMSIADKVNM